jgi:hypothetical protein
MNNKLIDTALGVKQDADGLYRTNSQHIPDSFIKELQEQKTAGGYTDSGEMLKMASIPVVIVEQMMREGVDVYKAPIKDIIKWLRNNDMDHFLTTTKRI